MSPPAGARAHRRGLSRALGGGLQDARRAGVYGAVVDHADDPAERPPWWRYLLWPTLAAVALVAGMLAGGVPPWRAVAIAVAAGLALWAVIVCMTVPQPEWPYELPSDTYRTVTTWEVPGLVGASESEVSFQHYLRPRLWELAQELLRRRGIEPDSPRAVALVGHREYALLSGADTDPKRAMASVSVLCHTIARLAVQDAPGSEPAIRNPALAGLAGAPARPRRVTRSDAEEGHHR